MANQDTIDKQTRQAEQQAERGDTGQTQGDDKISRVTQNIATLLQRIIHEGLSVNGLIAIQGLTITSVDKAKDLGMLPGGFQGGPIMGQKGGVAMGNQQGQQEGQQVSREEFDSLRQEIEQIKNMIGQKGGQAAQSAGQAGQQAGQQAGEAAQSVGQQGQEAAQQGQKGGEANQQDQGQEQQGEKGGQVSREELDALKENINKLTESAGNGKKKGKS